MTDSRIVDTIATALNGHPDDFRVGSDLRRPAERVLAALRSECVIAVRQQPLERHPNNAGKPGGIWPIILNGETDTVAWIAADDDEPIHISGIGGFSLHEAYYLGACLIAAVEKARG